jgi:multiple sugar transport system substrate-binding protein
MESEGYKNNKQIYAITVTDPEYIADSCSPGNFRGWSSLLSDCLVNLFNAVVYDDNADGLLEDAQKTADQIIAKEYGTGK